MTQIAKIDSAGDSFAVAPQQHPAVALWTHPQTGLAARVQAAMHERGAHPSRTLVLLPYAQLLPWASRWWSQCFPDGFAPRFETTMNWASSNAAFSAAATDIRFDMALDMLTARALLKKAGLGAHQEALAALVVEAAHQLAPLAAACDPAQRAQWAASARLSARVGLDAPALAMEAAVAALAVEWAALSGYGSDALFDPAARDALDCLIVVHGFSVEPLAEGLRAAWGDALAVLGLAPPAAEGNDPSLSETALALHPCSDAEDEAQRSAACVLRHVHAGRIPVALVSTDRVLTRRIRATLEGTGVRIRDENGWMLSTTRAAAQVLALLRAATWNASTDAVLDWLKSAPAFVAAVDAVEGELRRKQLRDWGQVTAQVQALPPSQSAWPQAVESANQIRAALQGRRTLAPWLDLLRQALQSSGLWQPLQDDAAGAKVLEVLRLGAQTDADWQETLETALWAPQRLDLAEFTQWVSVALEGARFVPPYPQHEQVVVLPMSQMLGRAFAAVVLAGCDEVRLDPAPEPPGRWSAAQRLGLGLPTREDLHKQALAAWQQALLTPQWDVLWRCSDETGETLLPGAWVQMLQAAAPTRANAPDPRVQRWLPVSPIQVPQPTAAVLCPTHLSASGYDDLRHCPYRFFALRQLGLRNDEEFDGEVGKRDFGVWLHEVLKRFHEALALQPQADNAAQQSLMDAAAQAATEAQELAEGDFLPFAAAWPAVRAGYLNWLAEHQRSGAVFERAEAAQVQPLGAVTLVGRIDRIDRAADGTALVLDYKTEASGKTRQRVQNPLEDTQMAFYAALLSDDTLRAAYVNVGERDGTHDFEQVAIVAARDALVEGIAHDMQAIAQGAVLSPLGDGAACDYCQARALCRKDWWAAA